MNSISYEKKPNVDEVKHDYLINKMSIKEIIDKLPFEDENEVINFLDWYGINSKGYSPFGIGTDFNNKIDLIKEENYHNYNFLEAPIKTNKRYVQSKMEKKKEKILLLEKMIMIMNKIIVLLLIKLLMRFLIIKVKKIIKVMIMILIKYKKKLMKKVIKII